MPRLPQNKPYDASVLEAWCEQVAAASETPWLARELVRRGDALLPQFASWYTRLRRLPRRIRRALQRRAALSLGGVALLFALGQGPAHARLIEVDGTTCSLVNAITAANTDTAVSSCPAGNGADVLRLEPPGRTVTLTQIDNTTSEHGPNGLPVITSDITIAGPGTIERDEHAPEFRIFEVAPGGALTLEHIVVRKGVNTTPKFVNEDVSLSFGGGIYGHHCHSVTLPDGIDFDDASALINRLRISIKDSKIIDNKGSGIFALNCRIATINTEISNNTGHGIDVEHEDETIPIDEISGIRVFGFIDISNSVVQNNHLGGLTANEFTGIRIQGTTVSGNGGRGVSAAGYASSVSVADSTVSGNMGTGIGGGSYGAFVSNSTVSGNMGAGISHGGSSAFIDNSIITGNHDGGISAWVTYILEISNSIISGNTKKEYEEKIDSSGGGIFALAGYFPAKISNSTISGNTTSGDGGGIYVIGDIAITNSTISGNTAGEQGGGISQSRRGSLNITSSTITDNHADGDGGGLWRTPSEGFHISHSLVSGNTASGDGAEIVAMSSQSQPVTHEFNIFGVDNQSGVVGFTPGSTDIVPAAGVNIGDILDPNLADNGGPAPTHALVPDSLAIDAGQADCTDAGGDPLTTDQRGLPRPVDGNGDSVAACDIGAFEFQTSDLRQVIDFEGLPAGKVVKTIYADGGFGPIKVRGVLGSKCTQNAAVVFDSSCASGVCSGGDDDLGTPNETFAGPGVGVGGEAGRLSANDTPLGNLLIVHEKCWELSDRFVEDPNDTRGDSQITLRFPEPVRVFSYTVVDHEKSQGERDRVKFYGPQGKHLASMSSPDTGDNGKAVVETTSDGTGIGGVMRIVFKRTGSRGLDNIVFVPEGSESL